MPLATEALSAMISTVDESNLNLNEHEKELLRWHQRLGHLGFRKIQLLMRSGVLAHSEKTRRLHTRCCKIETPPKCGACLYGKQTRKPSPGKTSSVVQDNVGNVKKDHLLAGQRVSVDHFVCSTKGRLFGSHGRTQPEHMYSGGGIFVDHATGYVHIEHQVHLTSHETLQAKDRYEDMCRDHGIIVQSYLSDNSTTFTSSEYTTRLSVFKQIMRFAGVGAHHHNGVAERSIGTIMAMARTMMLHAAIHWPDSADPTLWPMAVTHAAFLFNHVPNETTGISPNDLFTKTRWAQSKFHDIHVWGCPVYVLNSTIADGKKIPKWKPRSERTVYMGLSPKHTSQVPLVLNQRTRHITPQYHVVFDDWFATVGSPDSSLPDFHSPEWAQMFGDSEFQFPFDDDDLQAMPDLEALPSPASTMRDAALRDAFDEHRPAAQLPVPPLPTERLPVASVTPESLPVATSELPTPRRVAFDEQPTVLTPKEPVASPDLPSPPSNPVSPPREPPTSPWREPLPVSVRREPSAPTSSQREIPRATQAQSKKTPGRSVLRRPPVATRSSDRPTRNRVAPTRYTFDGVNGYAACTNFQESFPEAEIPDLQISKATVSDPDTLGWDEEMAESEPHRSHWLKAAQSEISALEGKHCRQ